MAAPDGRILQVVATATRRGAETAAVNLAGSLGARGYEVRTVAVGPAPVPGDGIDLPVLGTGSLGPRVVAALRREMRAARVTVAYGSRAVPACFLAGLAGAGPYVYRGIGDPRVWAARADRRVRVGLYLRRAAAVVAQHPAAADALGELYRLDRAAIAVIPSGRDPEAFPLVTPAERAVARTALGLPAAAPVALFLGALSAEKDPGAAVDAVARIPGVHLIVAGDGPERGRVAERCARLLAGRARVLGAVGDPRPALRASDVLVLTSRTEGTPGAVMEAAFSGRPTVAFAVGGVPSLVVDRETGRLVAPGDTEALAAALAEVLAGDPRALGLRARAHGSAVFALGPVTDAWEELLARFPGPGRGGRRTAGAG